jgi:hypothetical protein
MFIRASASGRYAQHTDETMRLFSFISDSHCTFNVVRTASLSLLRISPFPFPPSHSTCSTRYSRNCLSLPFFSPFSCSG